MFTEHTSESFRQLFYEIPNETINSLNFSGPLQWFPYVSTTSLGCKLLTVVSSTSSLYPVALSSNVKKMETSCQYCESPPSAYCAHHHCWLVHSTAMKSQLRRRQYETWFQKWFLSTHENLSISEKEGKFASKSSRESPRAFSISPPCNCLYFVPWIPQTLSIMFHCFL